MNTLSIVICHCVGWQPVINAIPCFCWGILALVMLYFLLKYVVAPLIANIHETIMKSKAFKQEKFWAFFNRMEKPVNEELGKTKKELYELKKKEKELEKGRSELEKEKEKHDKMILEEKIEIYEKIINSTK